MLLLKAKQILCCLLTVSLTLVHAYVCKAQFSDNFSDGDFTANPTWVSDAPENWVIENGRLRSNSSTASSGFWISTVSAKATNAQWEFYTNLQFNTSNANYVDVYLVSANENLLAPGNNGYFVRIGGTPDEVSLYKIVAGTTSVIIDGTDGVTNASNNTLKIKVVRDENDVWTLAYDNTGTGNNYFSEPPVTDNTISAGNYFGIRITQSTASFFNRHFFDDFYAGDIIPDTEPPGIISVSVMSSTELNVVFNDKLDAATAQTTTHYTVNNGVGNPQSATLQPDEKTVRLVFATEFPNAVTSRLTVTDVEDLSGNAVVSATSDFFFFQPLLVQYKDVIITEIFPDPSPVIGLPEAEFVELYNRSTNPINLMGWKFSDPTSTAVLPEYILFPDSYVILTPNASVSAFATLGQTIGVSNFPTLNNNADNLALRDASDKLIDAVNYTDAWYKDDDKRQGGWTLELIDPDNICAEEENWSASEHTSGGTPGQENSVKASKPDLIGPGLLSAMPVSSTTIKLVFDKKLSADLPPVEGFSFSPALSVVSVLFASSTLRELLIEVASPVMAQQTYAVTVNHVRDCSGNLIRESASTVSFGFPEEAQPRDVVINELLFNPKPFGVDFIEVYNRSAKYINLKNWGIGNFENGTATNLRTITTDDFLLAPGGIIAFTIDPFTIRSHYPQSNQGAVVRVASLPAFPDNEGSASVVSNQGELIDNVRYSRDYHSIFLRDKEGVSLERIYADEPGDDPNNWKSAASTVGFATPGYRNSNALNAQPISGEVKIEPEIFIPLFGQPDFTEIRYSFDQGGRVANIKIVDQQGREIRQIANNEILAADGFFRWDGDRNDGTKARPGYYVVWFEVFDASGRVDTFRKRVVVVARY
ncbi:MAG: lamin tail domain-containing protein [Cyclobacteriaceae bacterium]|nr:lamin tail domain-containing protein [Cyclobacteriaceae bacterium]